LALALAWVLHAALDWDWEVPAVTVWLFAAGGAALALPATTGRSPWPFGARAAGALALAAAAVVPWLLATSERRVDRALTRLEARDCAGAVDEAQAARAVLHHQPEPPAIMAICAAAAGRHREARYAITKAIDLDPRDWQYRFDLAVLNAAAGQDPSRAIAAARQLNPRSSALLGSADGVGTAGRTTPVRLRGLDYPTLTDLSR
jgi:hypothetical protein